MKPSAMPLVGELSLCFFGSSLGVLEVAFSPVDASLPPSFFFSKQENSFENCDNSSKNFKACSEFFSSLSKGFTERSKSGFCER